MVRHPPDCHSTWGTRSHKRTRAPADSTNTNTMFCLALSIHLAGRTNNPATAAGVCVLLLQQASCQTSHIPMVVVHVATGPMVLILLVPMMP